MVLSATTGGRVLLVVEPLTSSIDKEAEGHPRLNGQTHFLSQIAIRDFQVSRGLIQVLKQDVSTRLNRTNFDELILR